MSLNGKVIAVAGAAGNAGQGIVAALLNEGATVYALSRSQQRLDTLKPSRNGRLVPHLCKAFDDRLFQEIGSVDMAVSSLGLFVEDTRLATLPNWDAFVQSNLNSHFHFCSSFIRHAKKGGALLMVNGESSLKPRPGSGVISIMDAAQAMMMRVFAAEEKHLRISELMITDWISNESIPVEKVGLAAIRMLATAPSGAVGRLALDGFSVQE